MGYAIMCNRKDFTHPSLTVTVMGLLGSNILTASLALAFCTQYV